MWWSSSFHLHHQPAYKLKQACVLSSIIKPSYNVMWPTFLYILCPQFSSLSSFRVHELPTTFQNLQPFVFVCSIHHTGAINLKTRMYCWLCIHFIHCLKKNHFIIRESVWNQSAFEIACLQYEFVMFSWMGWKFYFLCFFNRRLYPNIFLSITSIACIPIDFNFKYHLILNEWE